MNENEKNVTPETVETPAENASVDTPTDDNEKKQPTAEELIQSLAKANAENARLRNKADEAASEAARYKKALRERQTAEEVQTEEKLKAQEEHNKYVAELEDYKRLNEARTRYLRQGMSADYASKAAEAEVKGDFDTLAAVQTQYYDAQMKAKEAEILRSNPGINAGNGEDGGEVDPFVAGWNSNKFR